MVADVEDRQDIGVVERRSRACLLRKALKAITIRRVGNRQNFDCHGTIESGVVGAINLTHSTCAYQRLNLVRTELGACIESHRMFGLYSSTTMFNECLLFSDRRAPYRC